MKKLLLTGLIVLTLTLTNSGSSIAQEKPSMRGVGPANFYLSLKEKIGLSKEQEEKLMTIEKEAVKKLGEIGATITKTQHDLNKITREENVDLQKSRELLTILASLEANGKYVVIESMVLENKVLTKEQRDKAKEIALSMSKGNQESPPPPPAKK